jgi:hypothetical protein
MVAVWLDHADRFQQRDHEREAPVHSHFFRLK